MSETRKPMYGVWVFAIRVVALVAALGGGWAVPDRARAEDELRKARAEAGQIWYEKYCKPCHGEGGAPGSAVYRESKQPVDLRTYVQRHGGEFPAANWIAGVYSPRPGGTHTKVWEEIHRRQEISQNPDIEARGIVAVIADYIMSVQAK